jgi:hypothetical protein
MNRPAQELDVQGQDVQGQDVVKDPSFRPRFTRGLASAIKRASALAGMSVPQYLETVVGPLVHEDLRKRVTRAAHEYDSL